MHNVLGFIDWHYADMPLPELYILEYHGLHYVFPTAEEMTAAANTVVATWTFDEFGDGIATGQFPSGLKGVTTLESVDDMMEGIYYLTDNVGGVLTGLAGLKAIDDLSRMRLRTNVPSSGKKFNQLAERGWSQSSIDDVVNSPFTTRTATNKSTGNAATAFYRKDGHYVVRDDVTGDLVQMSDTRVKAGWGELDWKPDNSIKDPYIPD
jgi:hypothetical protein